MSMGPTDAADVLKVQAVIELWQSVPVSARSVLIQNLHWGCIISVLCVSKRVSICNIAPVDYCMHND